MPGAAGLTRYLMIFVLVAGGWSLLLLAIFYGIIDGLRFRRWAFFFVVIGANAITVYLMPHFIDFGYTARFFFGGLVRESGSLSEVFMPASDFLVKWLFLLWLYRRGILLRA